MTELRKNPENVHTFVIYPQNFMEHVKKVEFCIDCDLIEKKCGKGCKKIKYSIWDFLNDGMLVAMITTDEKISTEYGDIVRDDMERVLIRLNESRLIINDQSEVEKLCKEKINHYIKTSEYDKLFYFMWLNRFLIYEMMMHEDGGFKYSYPIVGYDYDTGAHIVYIATHKELLGTEKELKKIFYSVLDEIEKRSNEEV